MSDLRLKCVLFYAYRLALTRKFRYSFDAPKRTPQEDLELVARNNLIIQRFLDELPASMRSTDTIQNKSTGIVYLQFVAR